MEHQITGQIIISKEFETNFAANYEPGLIKLVNTIKCDPFVLPEMDLQVLQFTATTDKTIALFTNKLWHLFRDNVSSFKPILIIVELTFDNAKYQLKIPLYNQNDYEQIAPLDLVTPEINKIK